MGKGIAFSRKVGQEIDENNVEKVFTIENPNENSKIQRMISQIPIEFIHMSERIITRAKEQWHAEFNEHVFVALADHLSFAVQRINSGIEIKNGLLWEIERIYQREYEIGLLALSWIEEEIGVKMPKDEAGFIAVHLINASMGGSMIDTMSITTVIEDILKIIRYYFAVDLDEESIAFDRLVNHLRFFAQRVITKKSFDEHEDEDVLLSLIEQNYAKSYDCALKIRAYIEKNYDHAVSNTELVYLSMYIKKVISRSIKLKQY